MLITVQALCNSIPTKLKCVLKVYINDRPTYLLIKQVVK